MNRRDPLILFSMGNEKVPVADRPCPLERRSFHDVDTPEKLASHLSSSGQKCRVPKSQQFTSDDFFHVGKGRIEPYRPHSGFFGKGQCNRSCAERNPVNPDLFCGDSFHFMNPAPAAQHILQLFLSGSMKQVDLRRSTMFTKIQQHHRVTFMDHHGCRKQHGVAVFTASQAMDKKDPWSPCFPFSDPGTDAKFLLFLNQLHFPVVLEPPCGKVMSSFNSPVTRVKFFRPIA